MGTIIVWALVRYRFPGRRVFDAIVDIPFALPTAVAGVAPAAISRAASPISSGYLSRTAAPARTSGSGSWHLTSRR